MTRQEKMVLSMRMLATVTWAIFLSCSWLMPVVSGEGSKAQRAEALAKYGFDPSTSLESRIGETPAAVLGPSLKKLMFNATGKHSTFRTHTEPGTKGAG